MSSECTEIQPGHKPENTSQQVADVIRVFLQNVSEKQISGNVNLEVTNQCNITPNSQDAFLRRGTLVVSSSVRGVLCLHALVFCDRACKRLICMPLQAAWGLFSHKRKERGGT